ncbi:MAG TPA: hypothetical protein VMQ99_00300 [Acetobacteraceae bacterium]|nr:hypothetical protein [Acetobacteraceae bacterium]
MAGIGNILRHDYMDVARDVLWYEVRQSQGLMAHPQSTT